MDLEKQAERLISEYLVPLLVGGLAAFFYLALLARIHLRARLMIGLFREAGRLREKQEEIKKREGDAPHLEKYRRLEQGILKLLDRDGMRPAAPAPTPAPVPAPAIKARR